MLREQLRSRGIHDSRVLAAMARIPRERFIGDSPRELAYADRALSIDCGQTISQPYIVALMSEALELTGGEHVLEIGTGSGYQTAVLAELARDVVSIERHVALSAHARSTLASLGIGNVELLIGDGTQGWVAGAPYDAILVAAAADRCPAALWDQLAEGGTLVIPLGGPSEQVLYRLCKINGERDARALTGCRFVPLVSGPAS